MQITIPPSARRMGRSAKRLLRKARGMVSGDVSRRTPSLQSLHCVFIVGCQRSGTTLTGQILGAHPDALLIDEDHGVDELIQAMLSGREDTSRILQNCFDRSRIAYNGRSRLTPNGELVPSVTHLIFKAPNATYDFEELKALDHPNLQFVFLTRDARDVVCSMQKLTNVAMVENQLKRLTKRSRLSERFSKEIARIQNPQTPDHLRKTLVWLIKSGLHKEFDRPPLNALRIRYEDLVSKPEFWITNLLEHVGLDASQDLSRHHETVFRGFGPGLTLRTREIDKASIGRWQEQLTDEEESDVWDCAEPLMCELGYQREQPFQEASESLVSPEELSAPIVATGRGGSGTRLLAEAIREHGVFLGNQFNRRCEDSIEWVDLIYEMGLRALAGDLKNTERRNNSLTRHAENILNAGRWQPYQQWGWKLPESMLSLPQICDAFRQAKIIHLVRHPLDVCLRRTHVTSRMDNPVGKATLLAAYRWLKWDRDPQADADHIRNAASWAYQVEHVTQFGRSLESGRFLEIRYEDLCNDPQHESNRIANFLDRSTVDSRISQFVDNSRRRNWSDDDERLSEVWAVCRKTAALLNYQFPES